MTARRSSSGKIREDKNFMSNVPLTLTPNTLNDTTPAAPAGNTNVTWQTDGSGNASAYVPSQLPPRPRFGIPHMVAYDGSPTSNAWSAGGANPIPAMNWLPYGISPAINTTAATATEPAYVNFGVAGATGSYFSTSATAVVAATRGIIQFFSCRLKLSSISSMRVWVGFGSQAPANTLVTTYQSSDPSASVIGFRYVSGTDTNWQCVDQKSGVGSQTLTDSGVVASTSTVLLELALDATNVYFYINGTLVGTVALTDTNMPTAGTAMFPFLSADNGSASSAKVGFSHMYWETSI